MTKTFRVQTTWVGGCAWDPPHLRKNKFLDTAVARFTLARDAERERERPTGPPRWCSKRVIQKRVPRSDERPKHLSPRNGLNGRAGGAIFSDHVEPRKRSRGGQSAGTSYRSGASAPRAGLRIVTPPPPPPRERLALPHPAQVGRRPRSRVEYPPHCLFFVFSLVSFASPCNLCFTVSLRRSLEMAEALKLLYIVVVDEVERGDGEGGKRSLSFRYTRPVLQSTLQLMGCKARHAFKVGCSMRSA
ncbi:hypothetical protein BHE74_00009880 [Ensete ventricosum]|nr:hypothetical protein BHE74_00009880 [Ensete ventricosum]